MTIVELDKFLRSRPESLKNLLDMAELWCYLLRESGAMDMKSARELAGKGRDMKEATDHLIKLSKNEKIRLYEEARWREKAERLAREDYVRDEGRDEGREEGLQRGLEQGRGEGLQRGLEQGRGEGRQEERRQLALKLLNKKTDISFISEVTGLSKAEINKITSGN